MITGGIVIDGRVSLFLEKTPEEKIKIKKVMDEYRERKRMHRLVEAP